MIDLESKAKLKIFGNKIVPAEPVNQVESLTATVREWNLPALRSIVVSSLDLNLLNTGARLPSAQIGLVFQDRTYLAVEVDRAEYTIIESMLAASEHAGRDGDDEIPAFSARPLTGDEMTRILRTRAESKIGWIPFIISLFIAGLFVVLALFDFLPSDSFQALVVSMLFFSSPIVIFAIYPRFCNPESFICGARERVAYDNALRAKAE